MPSTSYLSSALSTLRDRLTGQQVNKNIIFICLSFLHLALGVLILSLDRLCYMDILHLFTGHPRLTGQEANIGEQYIMGIPYLFTCQPFLLSNLFSSSVIINAIYGVVILLWGVWGVGTQAPYRAFVIVPYRTTVRQVYKGGCRLTGL